MEVLLIGGPRFLGMALLNTLLEKKHNVTVFNRGKTNPTFFDGKIKKITGNRDGEISKIGNKTFDVVIDTCGYVPRVVKQSVEYLQNKTTKYVFISSISVYEDSTELDRDETAKVIELENKTTEDIMGQPSNYGGLKVLCEGVVQEAFGKQAIIIRPGLIVGPHDPSNRFTYWPVRIRKGGNILVPGDSCKVQIIDVRDLAEFIVTLLEKNKAGVYNATGPEQSYEFREIAEKITEVTQANVNFQWVNNTWLQEQNVGPWMEFPLWEPSAESQASMQVSIEKALQDGLQFRSLEDTVQATLKWYDEIGGDTKTWSAGLKKEKEDELLKRI